MVLVWEKMFLLVDAPVEGIDNSVKHHLVNPVRKHVGRHGAKVGTIRHSYRHLAHCQEFEAVYIPQ